MLEVIDSFSRRKAESAELLLATITPVKSHKRF
jgi:hypothetical protein